MIGHRSPKPISAERYPVGDSTESGAREVRGEDGVEMVVLVPFAHLPRLLLAQGRQRHVVPAR